MAGGRRGRAEETPGGGQGAEQEGGLHYNQPPCYSQIIAGTKCVTYTIAFCRRAFRGVKTKLGILFTPAHSNLISLESKLFSLDNFG